LLRLARREIGRGSAVILVRLLLFLSLAAIVVAAVMYLFSKDRRYVRFIWHVAKFTVVILAVVLIFYAFERLVGPML
jgi:peptidoglycan biosynthesis protein MviN/MurJ (putative lipid II flippase)